MIKFPKKLEILLLWLNSEFMKIVEKRRLGKAINKYMFNIFQEDSFLVRNIGI